MCVCRSNDGMTGLLPWGLKYLVFMMHNNFLHNVNNSIIWVVLMYCLQKTTDARRLEPSYGQGKYHSDHILLTRWTVSPPPPTSNGILFWTVHQDLIPRRIVYSTLLSNMLTKFDCVCFVTRAAWWCHFDYSAIKMMSSTTLVCNHGMVKLSWKLDHDQSGKECLRRVFRLVVRKNLKLVDANTQISFHRD